MTIKFSQKEKWFSVSSDSVSVHAQHGSLLCKSPLCSFYWMGATNILLNIWNFYHGWSLLASMTSCTELRTQLYLILSIWRVFWGSAMHMWAHFYHFWSYSTLRMVWVQVLEMIVHFTHLLYIFLSLWVFCYKYREVLPKIIIWSTWSKHVFTYIFLPHNLHPCSICPCI